MQEVKKIAFIAHWVENWNWLLWVFVDLHKNPQNHKYGRIFSPVYFLMSLVYLFGNKVYDVVDKYTFNDKIVGETVLLRNFAWHFFVKSQRNKIRKRILDSVLDAQGRSADVIGLGALTKAEWLTQGGSWIVNQLGEYLQIPIVHGDTLTSAVVVKQALKLRPKSVFITGSTSKIGRAVVLALAMKKIHVTMYTSSVQRFYEIKNEAGDNGKYIKRSENLLDGAKCNIWVTGKAVPSGKSLLEFIPLGATVLNFSVPNPLTKNNVKTRQDVCLMEGGLLAYDPKTTSLEFTMRLKPGITYACHAGTMVHAIKGWTHHEVGPVDVNLLEETFEAALSLGFFLPKREVKTELFKELCYKIASM